MYVFTQLLKHYVERTRCVIAAFEDKQMIYKELNCRKQITSSLLGVGTRHICWGLSDRTLEMIPALLGFSCRGEPMYRWKPVSPKRVQWILSSLDVRALTQHCTTNL